MRLSQLNTRHIRGGVQSIVRPTCLTTLMASAVFVLSGCQRDTQTVRGGAVGDVTLPQGTAGREVDTAGLPNEGALARVAVGDIAGSGNNTLDPTITNPYAGNRAAILEGRDRFAQMNCVGCHGYDLKGGMGPDLTDTYWRYGGSAADIYKSIYEGRPQGMPAWGRTLPPATIWKIVAYIQAKGGAFPGRMADQGRQGDLGDEDTTAGSTLKGRNSAP